MVITGAGPGIMEAGIEGAGAANSFGVEHPPAVRGGDDAVPRRRPEARQLPLLLHPQGHVREGGARVRAAAGRLRHARRGVRAAHAGADRARRRRRRSCCSTSRAARTGSRGCSSSSAELRDRGYISPHDLELVKITDDVDVALEEITALLPQLPLAALRRRRPRAAHARRSPMPARLAALNDGVRRHRRARRDRAGRGRARPSSADDDVPDLARLRFRFDRRTGPASAC